MNHSIRTFGDPVLRLKAQEVKAFDSGLQALVGDMFETMKEAGGIGLAAPQIGISQRVIVIDLQRGPKTRWAVINPKLQISGEPEAGEEGCLSIPGISGEVTRLNRVRLEGVDPKGEVLKFETEGLLARALQHEVDHLDGIFFVDRLSTVRRALISGKLKRLEKDYASGKKIDRPVREKAESLL